ncbi:hypothetical protein [Streptomyces griseofuscus]
MQSARHQLGGPIAPVRDSLHTHLTAGMRRYVTDRDWLTVFQLPPCAPALDPVEGAWSVLRRTTAAGRAFAGPDGLITAVRGGLRHHHHRHDVNCSTRGAGRVRRSTGRSPRPDPKHRTSGGRATWTQGPSNAQMQRERCLPGRGARARQPSMPWWRGGQSVGRRASASRGEPGVGDG